MKCRQLLKYLALKFVKKQYSMNAFDFKKNNLKKQHSNSGDDCTTDKKKLIDEIFQFH